MTGVSVITGHDCPVRIGFRGWLQKSMSQVVQLQGFLCDKIGLAVAWCKSPNCCAVVHDPIPYCAVDRLSARKMPVMPLPDGTMYRYYKQETRRRSDVSERYVETSALLSRWTCLFLLPMTGKGPGCVKGGGLGRLTCAL